MELIAWLLLEAWSKPRFLVPVLLGIGAGASLFYITGKQPSSAAIAISCAVLGLVIGFVLEYFRDTPRGPER